MNLVIRIAGGKLMFVVSEDTRERVMASFPAPFGMYEQWTITPDVSTPLAPLAPPTSTEDKK